MKYVRGIEKKRGMYIWMGSWRDKMNKGLGACGREEKIHKLIYKLKISQNILVHNTQRIHKNNQIISGNCAHPIHVSKAKEWAEVQTQGTLKQHGLRRMAMNISKICYEKEHLLSER